VQPDAFNLVLVLIFGALAAFSLGGLALAAVKPSVREGDLLPRTRSWWLICLLVLPPLAAGQVATTILFGLISLLCLREYLTAMPFRPADHRTLFWAFFIVTPLHYVLVLINWYGLYSIFIPVYVALLVPMRLVISGDTRDFMARAARIQWGVLLCVYLLSHAPALLALEIEGFDGKGRNLLLFLLLVVASSDVFQYVTGKLLGRHKITPLVSPKKTWEGFAGGIAASAIVGGLLAPWTPFAWPAAAALAACAAVAGFFGDVTMSAIKRDRGLKDFGALIEGHGGVLDRVDSLCFAAPIFFHLVRYFHT
jgi:phosphatidate cytidylyltransferase